MYLTIVFLPLLSSIISGLFGHKLGKKGASIFSVFCLFLTLFLCLIAFYEVGFCGSPCNFEIFSWIKSDNFIISWGFLFDSLTVVMLIVVTFVSSLVHLYSTSYMGEDPHLPRFMSYLSLFTFFMLILITANNFIQMFVGWEGVGLCSYLLINFWFSRLQANKASIKAMLINRIGDFGLSLGIFLIFIIFGSVDYYTVFSLVPFMTDINFSFLMIEANVLTIIGLLLFVGVMGKSAQIGLHAWLPDAMEGPTPVSALIHAATMVTAGVFLLARCSLLYEYAPNALIIVSIMGGLTAFFAATTALVQNDLKRVIAYSTCSQLGYMVFVCGLSNYTVGIFHLANHAFFKALLFLSAGSVIHAIANEQDMRRMGGLANLLPFTYAMMFIGSLALMGFPFLTGFYSKDVILEIAFAKYSINGLFVYSLGTLSAAFTAFYSIRSLYLTFITKPSISRVVLEHAHDAPWQMAIPLFLLSLGSIFIGYLTKDLIIGLGTDFWGNAIFILPQNIVLPDSEWLPVYIKQAPFIFTILGSIFGFVPYKNYALALKLFSIKISSNGRQIYTYLNRKWFFDKIANEFISKNSLNFAYHTSYKNIDRGIIEIFGPLGISNLLKEKINLWSKYYTGLLYHYAFIIFLSVTLFITLVGFANLFYLYINYQLYIIFILLSLIIKHNIK